MLSWIVDSRSGWPDLSDQGPRPTCLSMAITAAHEYEVRTSLSAEYLHWATGQYPGGRGNPHAAAQALRNDGQPPHEQWPYDVATDDRDGQYAPPATVKGPYNCRRADRYLADLDGVIAELGQGRWPIVALRVTDAFAAAGSGIVLPDGPGRAGHAVLAVGVLAVSGTSLEPHLHDGERLLCVRNSWGAGWGVDGHKLISETALNDCHIASFVLDPTT